MSLWLEEFYREQAPVLFRFLIRLTGNSEETRDVIQEIFTRLAQSPRMLDGVGAPRSYLFRMAHRLVIDRVRREQARQHREDSACRDLPLASAPATLGDEAAWLQKILGASLNALPPGQKAVVVLKVWEEMTFAEIAAVLDISVNTAASRYRYALDKLRAELRPLHRNLP
jgi:RNA polymerase sigma-70 factor (ECF subfamily)